MHHTKEMPAQPRRRAGLRWVSLVLSMVVLAVLLVPRPKERPGYHRRDHRLSQGAGGPL